MELHKRLEEEKVRAKALEASVDAWARSQRIREYLEAVEARADPADEALQAWLSWARNYADWQDPLTESPPSILDEAGSVSGLVGSDSSGLQLVFRISPQFFRDENAAMRRFSANPRLQLSRKCKDGGFSPVV